MALSTENPAGGGGAKGAKAAGRAQVTSFAGSEGRGVKTGGPETTYRSPNGQEVKRPNREHNISTELADRLGNNVREELDKMIQEQTDMGDAAFRAMYQESNHRQILKIFDEYTEPDQAGGRGLGRTIKDHAFADYMKSSDGLTDAYRITMRKLQDMAVPSAVMLRMLPGRPTPGLVEEGNVVTGGDQGGLRAGLRSARQYFGYRSGTPGPRGRYNPPGGTGARANAARARYNAWYGLPRTRGGKLAGLSAIPTAIAIANPLAGLGAYGVEAAYLAARHGLRQGERLDTVRAAQALRAVVGDPRSGDPRHQRANPAEVEYMRRHLLINPHDVQIVRRGGQDVVEMRQNGLASTRIDAETLAEQINGYSRDILQFQEANHIRQNQQEAMDIRFLIDGSLNMTQNGTPLQQRVLDRFRNMNPPGGVQTFGGVPMERFNPAVNDWEPNPAFQAALRAGDAVDIHRNVEKWNKAYDGLACDDMDNRLDTALNKGANHKGDLESKTDFRLKTQGPDSQAARDQKEALTVAQTALGEVRTLAETTGTNMTSYESHVRTQRQTIEQNDAAIQAEEAKVLDIIPPATPAPPPAPPYAHPRNVQEALHRILTVPGEQFQLRLAGSPETITSLVDQRAALDTAIQSEYRTWLPIARAELTALQTALAGAGRNRDAIATQVAAKVAEINNKRADLRQNEFGHLAEQYDRQLALVTGILQPIEQNTRANETIRTSLLNRFDAQRRPVETTINRMTSSRTTIETWGATAGVTASGPIDRNALRTETFAVLQQRMNEANASALALITPITGIGWPEAENGNPANRERLLLAMADARAEAIEPRVITPSPELRNATDPRTYNFAELDIMALTAREIRDRIVANNRRLRTGLPVPSQAVIENIKAEAASRFRARTRALDGITTQINETTEAITEQIREIDTHGVRSPELQVIDRVRGNLDNIASSITSKTTAELTDMLDDAPIVALTPGYNIQERGYQRAYVNIIRWLADTVHDTEARYVVPPPAPPAPALTGPEAAFRRAREFITPAVVNTALDDVSPGVTLGNLQAEFAAGNFTKQQLVDALIEQIVFQFIEPRVDAA